VFGSGERAAKQFGGIDNGCLGFSFPVVAVSGVK
jgi:hypothetical protein